MKKTVINVLSFVWGVFWFVFSIALISVGIAAIVYTGTPLGLAKAVATLLIGLMGFLWPIFKAMCSYSGYARMKNYEELKNRAGF